MAELTWKTYAIGGMVDKPGSAREYRTGDWRSQFPQWDFEKCLKCGVCSFYCPDASITMNADGYPVVNEFFCKGCGICARECWSKCIKMVPEGTQIENKPPKV